MLTSFMPTKIGNSPRQHNNAGPTALTVRAAFRTMPVKTDRKDAAGIAQLMRLGWFRPVHCKSMAAQELRASVTGPWMSIPR